MRRWLACVAAAGVLGATLQTGTTAQAQAIPGFADGDWAGSLFYEASVVYDGEVPGDYLGSGPFALSVVDGNVEGDFAFDQTTVVRPPDQPEAIAVSRIEGVVTGAATGPELEFETIAVESTSSGITIDLTFTAAELGNPRIRLTPLGSGCGYVQGFWLSDFGDAWTAQGQAISGPGGRWSAHLSGADPFDRSEVEDAMDLIERDVMDLAEELRTDGFLTTDLIGDVLARAESLALGGVSRSECGPEVDDTTFRSRAYAAIHNLLVEAALNDVILPNVLFELVRVGHRTGVFDADPELEAFYNGLLDETFDAALGGGATQRELTTLYVAAVQLGRTDVAVELAAALEEFDR